MSQNLLMTLPGYSIHSNRRSRCRLACGQVGLRFVRYQCSPWWVLAIVPLKMLLVSGVERTQLQLRYFSAIGRINFVGVYGLLNDLLW